MGFKILNFNIFGGFQKNEYFFGNEHFVDIFFFFFFFLGGGGGGEVITKLDYIKGSFLCILGYFLRSRYRMGILFWVAKISHILGGA